MGTIHWDVQLLGLAIPAHAAWVSLERLRRRTFKELLLPSEYALANRLTPFVSMQNQHSAMYREEEREMMPMLKHYGIGVIPWGPMAGGCERLYFTTSISDR